MLPEAMDPRFAEIECDWNSDWGWRRNAANYLAHRVRAIISPRGEEEIGGNSKIWKMLNPGKGLREVVPELFRSNNKGTVSRTAEDLAELVRHPMRFATVLKIVDPHTSLERWTPTINAMLRHAGRGVSLEIHCARFPSRDSGPPTEACRRNWRLWADSQCKDTLLENLHVFFWDQKRPIQEELHDRYAVMGHGIDSEAKPFAGVQVGKGWDQARPPEDPHTTFSFLPKVDYQSKWESYSSDSSVLSRETLEDVIWSKR